MRLGVTPGVWLCALLCASSSAFAEARVTVEAENPTLDQDVMPLVQDAARRAANAAETWGALREPTRVIIVSNRDSLAIRVHDEGSNWLEGAADYDVVWLLSPHQIKPTHQLPSVGYLATLLTHELTHCVMQQACGTKDDYQARHIPFWFTEGMAMTASGEGAAALSREVVAAELSRRQSADPIRHGTALAQGEPRLAYSSAFWAFSLLDSRGRMPILQTLAGMRTGLDFWEAFAKVYGEPLAAFHTEVLTALRRNEALPHR
jgi:hypothetical protein